MIKAVIFDLDRTLLTSNKGLTENSIEVLNKCREKGIKLCIATARPYRTALPYLEKFPFDAVTVMNGAKVICGDYTDNVSMNESETLYLLEKLGEKDYMISLEMGDEVYGNKFIPYYDFKYFKNFPEIPEGEAPYKILVDLENKGVLEYIKEILPDSMYCSVSGEHLIQIMDKNANKYNGVLKMLKRLNIDVKEAVYIGDDFDDIEAIKNCGIGVAMANALDEVKKVADFITDTNDSEGAVKAVLHFLERK